MKHTLDRLTPTKIIVFGYLAIILFGTLLLMLPFATQSGQSTGFADALFTATSATCVTGLVVFDTATHWTLFGQLVLLLLIQIGGLGFITMAMVVAIFTRRRIGLRSRFVMQESISAPHMGGIVRLTRFVFKITLAVEGAGALLLSLRFIPRFGPARGIYLAIFHSISAFCNAGFDLMGTPEAGFVSLTGFVHDPLVNIVIMVLIVFGGLGFFVWEDLWVRRRDPRHYALQTKMVLSVTALLIVIPAVLLFLWEGDRTPAAALEALFQSVTARTAGFNTVNLSAFSATGQFLMIFLMLIGGSPGSTAGGMKTTTVAVLLLCVRASFRRDPAVESFNRRIGEDVLKNAVTIATCYIMLAGAGAMALCRFDGVGLMSALFETSSAVATVGLSLGLTPGLSLPSHLILIFLMYFGRVGCMTLVYAIAEQQGMPLSRKPLEKLSVG